MQQAIPLASKVPDAAAFLGSLMERLETDKSNLEQQGFDLTDSKFATVIKFKKIFLFLLLFF